MKGKVVALMGVEDLAIKEFDLPRVEPGALLLEVLRANVCGSDTHIWQGHHPFMKRGIVMGHEFVGRIVKMGEGVTTDYAGLPVEIGDRVVAPYFFTCLRCPPCSRGEFPLCRNAFKFMAFSPETPPHFHGSFATHYYVHPNQFFYKVPGGLSDEVVAGANCGLSQVLYGLDKSGLAMGETVVIQGAGGLGLYAVAVAKEKGARVIAVEGVEERLKIAEDFGADHLLDLKEFAQVNDRVEQVTRLTDSDGADVVLEVCGVPSAFTEALQLVRPGGRVVGIGNIFTGPESEVTFAPGFITRKSITVQGVSRYQPVYLYKALKFLEKYHLKYPFEKFCDREYTLSEATNALSSSAKRSIARPIIAPTQG